MSLYSDISFLQFLRILGIMYIQVCNLRKKGKENEWLEKKMEGTKCLILRKN